MPDAFLRRVIEQREREQELAQLYHHGVELPPDSASPNPRSTEKDGET